MGTLPLGTTGQLSLWQGIGLSLLKSALPKMLSAKVLSLLLHRPLCWSEVDAQLRVPRHFLYPRQMLSGDLLGGYTLLTFRSSPDAGETKVPLYDQGLPCANFVIFTWKCVILSFSWAGQPLTAPIVTFLWLFLVHYNSLQPSYFPLLRNKRFHLLADSYWCLLQYF